VLFDDTVLRVSRGRRKALLAVVERGRGATTRQASAPGEAEPP
jgi:hypothetical protein